MYRFLDRVNTQRGFALILFFCGSLLAFGQDPSEKRGGPDETDNAARRAAWFLRGRTVRGKSAAALLRNAHQQKLKIRQTTQERLLRQAAQQATGPGETSATAPPGGVLPMTVPSGSAWVNLGPAPITAMGRFGDASGRITSIVVDQNDSTGNTVYAAGAYGGVWKSTNAANADPTQVTWTPLYDTDPAAVTLAAGAVSLQPTNSSVILAGTGEPNNALDSYYGMGILRSTNGGASWTLISTATGGEPFDGMGVSKFAWKPDASVVVAGLSNATNLGPGAGGGFQGIYYSTDAGATWTRATNATVGDTVFGSVSDVVYNATLGKFFAALRRQGIYSSNDGITWTRLTNQPPVVPPFAAGCSATNPSPDCDTLRGQLTVKPGSAEMYAWIVDGDGTTNKGVFRTSDGGATAWTSLSVTGMNSCGDAAGGCGTSQGFYNLVLAAVPNGANTDLYAGAVNLFRCANSNSTTCTTWLNLTHVYGSCSAANVSIHPDMHAIDFLQSNTNIIYFGNDGGVYRTLTGQTGMAVALCNSATSNAFQDLNTSSLGSLTQFISISQHPTDDSVILGGTQDNGSPAIADGQTNPPLNPPLWFEAWGGDGGYNEIDQTNPNNWYVTNTDVSIQKCATGTDCIETDIFTDVVTSTTLSNDHGDFYTPWILDPANQAKLLVGTCRVWRVNNDGTLPTKLSNKLVAGTTTACGTSESSYVYSLAAGGPTTANGSQVIYAGTNDGKIFVTTNADGGTATWVASSTNPNQYVVSKVAIDTTDATGQTAYMTIMGFTGGGGHVFKTTNAGANWTDISAGLPDAPADSVVVDPIDHTIVYVGTDVGVFATNDGGANWSEYGTGLPNVATVALRTFNSGGTKKLRVGTHGRGVWETDLASATVGPTAPTADSVTPNSGSGTSQTFTFKYSDANGFADINVAQAIINSTLTYSNGCVAYFNRTTGGLSLHQDTGPSWFAAIPIGTPGTLENSQCSINVGASSASGSVNTLTLNLAITFKPAFTGAKNIYGLAQDNGALSSGWRTLGTWSPASSSPPTVVSVTPNSGSGATQTFSFQYSDADGFADINVAQAIINSSLTYSNGCVAYFNRSTGGLSLHQDTGPSWFAAIPIGTAGTLENSQCSINVGASSASGSVNTLTLNLAITFKPAFVGSKNIYGLAQDTGGLSSGWQALGTWAPPSPPAAVSVAPNSGSGTSQTFTFKYSDPNGFADINVAQAIINSVLTYSNGCVAYFNRSTGGLSLHQDTGPSWFAAIPIGTPGTLENSQCSINVGASSASGSVNTLTLNLAITFKTGFVGNKNVYGLAQDNGGLSSGWQTLGTWSPASSSPPTVVSVTPNSGSGATQTFSFQYSDADGFADIKVAQAIINSTLTYSNGCVAYFNRSTGGLSLHQDSGPSWFAAIPIGTPGTLENSQCSINVGASSASGSVNTLTLNLAITFKPAFVGSKNIYGLAQDTGGLSSGWQALGAWTVP